MKVIVALFLWVVIALPSGSAHAQNWANTEAKQTTAEFLQTYFELGLHRHETQGALNSYNLTSFYPGTSPSTAVLVIIQTYNDKQQSTDNPYLRQEIRKTADGLTSDFASRFGLPVLKKRWPISNPKENLILKHVRVNDLQDTLAVTINGVTSFDPSDFKAAEQKVKNAGGIWAW